LRRLRNDGAGLERGTTNKIGGGDKTVMKKNYFQKGNFRYQLSYDERENTYSFVVYVKIKSKKGKIELNSTRAKEVDICFKDIGDEVLKKLSEKNIEILKSLMIELEVSN
jgi:hypothetical protein